MQHVAANNQLIMLIQRVTSQLVIETGRVTQHGQDAQHGDGDGRSSFRRQRVVRAKRGESIKKARPNHCFKSSDTSTKQRNAHDLSSDESGDSGRYSDSYTSCSSRHHQEMDKMGKQEGEKMFPISTPERECKTPNKLIVKENVSERSTNNKLVINIQSEATPDQIKHGQGIISPKQPILDRNKYSVSQSNPSELYLPVRQRTVTLHVPGMGGEQIVQV